MIPPFERVSLTELRAALPRHLEFVTHRGGHLWLMNHKRLVAGVVPVAHMRMIERFETKTLSDIEREHARAYERWEQVKKGAAEVKPWYKAQGG